MNIGSQVQNISVADIVPNKSQPRLIFDDKSLQELANSIKEHGIIQPLVLRQIGNKYEIIAGERRYRAAVSAGLTEVPCIISEVDDNESAELALVENIQRKSLNSIEEAKSYKNILEQQNITQEELANRMGVSQSTIANKLRLLSLTEDVQTALLQDRISERHARSLLQITDSSKQIDMLNKIINDRLTVRQLDDEIANMNVNIPSETIESEPLQEEVHQDTNMFDTENDEINIFNPNPSSSGNMFDLPEAETTEEENIDSLSESSEEEPPKEEQKINNPFKNILSTFDKINRPSLDDEVTNMITDPDDNLFNNNYEENLESNEELETEQNSIVKEVEVPVQDPLYVIDSDNLNSVKRAYKHLCDEVRKAGYNINEEEFDFEDLYQLIIKIDK